VALLSKTIAGTGADDATIGTEVWATPENITADDSSNATCGVGVTISHYLKATNFGFSTAGVIDSITYGVRIKHTGIEAAKDHIVKGVKGGSIVGGDQAPGNFATTSAEQLWDFSADMTVGYTPSDVNASDFGMVFSVTGVNAGIAFVSVDYIQIQVIYTNDPVPEGLSAAGGIQAMFSATRKPRPEVFSYFDRLCGLWLPRRFTQSRRLMLR